MRRIEALTGEGRARQCQRFARLAKATASELRVPVEDVPNRIAALLDERKRLERELSDAKKKLAMGGGGKSDGADGVRTVGDVKLMARAVEGIDLKDLRSLADEGKKKVGSGIVAIVGVTGDGKAGIVVGVTDDLVEALQRRRSGAKGRRSARRQGRRRPAGYGAGRRPDGSKADAALAAIEAALGRVIRVRLTARRSCRLPRSRREACCAAPACRCSCG